MYEAEIVILMIGAADTLTLVVILLLRGIPFCFGEALWKR